MNEKYFPTEIEERQQQRWAEAKVFEANVDEAKPHFYCLEMLPYPSGRIHMGHVRNYSIGDALSAYKRMNGFNVLHPMGWDAFGMPAENAAIKNNSRPDTWTFENIDTMRAQLQRVGFSYDWRREIASCTPEYYRWNQWFFIQMFKKGLLYRKNATVNWCVKCNTSLANEQAEGGFCWRHEDTPVELRELEQWFIRVSKYADQLLDDLDTLEGGWPERVLTMQRNWIGRSRGAEVDFSLKGIGGLQNAFVLGQMSIEEKWQVDVRIFTTRIDTIFGASCMIVAPEHPLIDKWLEFATKAEWPEKDQATIDKLKAFVEKQRATSKEDRIAEGTEKEGVNTGLFAINPFNGVKLPIWTANFVLTGYGTGAIMAVPAHDERDFEFCKKYDLPIVRVIKNADTTDADDAPVEVPFTAKDESGTLINSGEWSGKTVPEAIAAMTAKAEAGSFGTAQTNFKIRDWGVSRQRAWGTPLPFIHCATCGIVPVPEDQLPVELPKDLNFNTQGAPLAEHTGFVNVNCPTCGNAARRDTDTMDTFVDSSWYYFRYVDPHNTELPFDPKVAAYWTPVDQYIGGIEHAVLHLIYTRLWTKIQRDLGLITFDEPVKKLLTQGMVCLATARCEEHDWLNPTEVLDGKCKFCGRTAQIGRTEKMSKSKKNTIDPDEMINTFGADTVRLFMLFAAPPEKDLEWDDSAVEGASRYLNRVWRIVHKWHQKSAECGVRSAECEFSADARALRRKTHQTIQRISNDIGQRMNFNTGVAALMELTNAIYDFDKKIDESNVGDMFVLKEALESLVKMLAPYTPHIAEELWAALGHNDFIVIASWPVFDAELAKADELEIPVQINGKMSGRVIVAAEIDDEALKQAVLGDDKIKAKIGERQIVKTIVVPKRLVNIVAK
ncbi:MAG: leucine--tRNA ligase [Acidobacteria bacterium]|nr:leucine--tRNA ligase [Acidobacteriota bacterium]